MPASEPTIPLMLPLPMSELVSLAVECWRLTSAIEGEKAAALPAPVRHALRRIGDLLHRCEIETQSMDGRAFDPGLAVRVIDAIDDPSLPANRAFITETLSPMVLWRGQVVKQADVVTRRGVQR